jgi:hypothetical protein
MLVSVHLEIVLFSTQDRCMVCAERTTGPKITSKKPLEHLGDEAQVDARFSSFGDSAILNAR